MQFFAGNGSWRWANAGKDTDGSQFFVTIGPQRFLTSATRCLGNCCVALMC